MRRLGYVVTAAAFLVLAATGVTGAASDKIKFSLKFSGEVDCDSPIKLEEVPLSMKAEGFLATDGSAGMTTVLTAYYFISWKTNITGKVGQKAVQAPGSVGLSSLRLLEGNGLEYTADYPKTQYIVRIAIDGKKCAATLTPKIKSGNQFEIYTDESTVFLCSRFQVDRTSCKISR